MPAGLRVCVAPCTISHPHDVVRRILDSKKLKMSSKFTLFAYLRSIRPCAAVVVAFFSSSLSWHRRHKLAYAQTSHGEVELCFIPDSRREEENISFVSCPIIYYYCMPDREWLLVGAVRCTRKMGNKFRIKLVATHSVFIPLWMISQIC